MKILDLGCGENKYKSDNAKDVVIGLDIIKAANVDVVWDLEKRPLPFKENEFDLIIASHILEHLQHKTFFTIMEELHRILKPDGILKIWVPNCCSPQAYNNPDHKRGFGLGSFGVFTKVGTKVRFEILKKKFSFVFQNGAKWKSTNKIINPVLNLWQGFTEKFFPFLPAEIYFELKCVK